MKIKNSINASEFQKNYEINTMPSMTIPDQTMSIRQIVERFAKGLPVDGLREPIWDIDNDLPDFNTLDLAERQELAQHYQSELENLNKRLKSTNVDKNNERVNVVESISSEPSADL